MGTTGSHSKCHIGNNTHTRRFAVLLLALVVLFGLFVTSNLATSCHFVINQLPCLAEIVLGGLIQL